MRLGIGLYVKNSVQAVQKYIKAFSLRLGYHVLNDDGTYFHSELYDGEGELFCVSESGEQANGCPVELGFTFETKEQLENAFMVLRENGRVKLEPGELPWSPLAAIVMDEFGINWYLSLPQHRPPKDFRP